MVIAALLLLVVVAVWLVRRRRKAVLAGLNSTKPVFGIEPPARRMNKRKHERL